MRISDETRHAQRLLAYSQQRRDVERLELRVDGHAVTVTQQAIEADRLAIDQHAATMTTRRGEGTAGLGASVSLLGR